MATHLFHEDFDRDTWIIILSFSFLCCLIQIILIAYLCAKFCFDREGRHINASGKILCVLSLILFLFAQILFFLYTYWVKLENITNEYATWIWGYYNLTWTLGYFFIYLLFYNRLKNAFQGTSQQVTRIEGIIFAILISLYMIGGQSNTVIWLAYNQNNWPKFNNIYNPLLYIRLFVDVILNTFVLYSFIVKLKRSFSNHQSKEVINIIVKLFLLTLFTVISTALFTMSEIVLSAAVGYALKTNKYGFYRATYAEYFTLGNVDMLVSAVYCVLTFSFTDAWYNACCKCAHVRCVKLCGRILSDEKTATEYESDNDTLVERDVELPVNIESTQSRDFELSA